MCWERAALGVGCLGLLVLGFPNYARAQAPRPAPRPAAAPAPAPVPPAPAPASPTPAPVPPALAAAAPVPAPAATTRPDGAGGTSPAPPTPGDAGNAGWNGEHFFLRSTDGQFQLSPIGYLNVNYTAYAAGDGTQPDNFAIKRARFGFQGAYGKRVDFLLTSDVVSTGVSVRDAYVQVKPLPELQMRVGQFKEPFSQEVAIIDTNVGFFDRSLLSALYPSATGSFRSPGAMVFGSIGNGSLEYWLGAFDGRGILAPPSSNWPELVGRLRISPLRWTRNPAVTHLSFGGSGTYTREALISKDQSFSGLLNDAAYTFFPSFPINGPVYRFGGQFLWLFGPVGIRGEYAELHEARDSVGPGSVGGGGYETFPTIVGRGAYGQLSCFLTGESDDENDPPKVRHPVVGPSTPGGDGSRGIGAIQLAGRFSWLSATAPGATFGTFTPTSIPTFKNNTDQITVGVHWYLNYWVIYKVDLDIDQLRQPSVEGFLPQNYFVVVQQVQIRF